MLLTLAAELCSRLERSKQLATGLALSGVQERVVSRLVALGRQDGAAEPDGLLIRNRPTQQELANQIGACRETVSRTVSELVRQGLLTPRGRSLLVSTQLHREAAPFPPYSPAYPTSKLTLRRAQVKICRVWPAKPRVARHGGGGDLVPLAEVDIRTSIRPDGRRDRSGRRAAKPAPVSQAVGPRRPVFGVVKADAYGHGAVAVARALEPLCNALAVSLVEEGLELRAAGIRAPIVVLGAYYNRHQDDVLGRAADPGRLRRRRSRAVRGGGGPARPPDRRARQGRHRHEPARRRGGAICRRCSIALEDLPALRLAGLCTHLASADLPDAAPRSRL